MFDEFGLVRDRSTGQVRPRTTRERLAELWEDVTQLFADGLVVVTYVEGGPPETET